MYHSNTHKIFISGERRFINQRQIPTTVAEIKDKIVEVSELVSTGAKEQAEEGLRGIREGLASLKDSLEVPELEEISNNLTLLSQRAAGNSLDALREQVDATREMIAPSTDAEPNTPRANEDQEEAEETEGAEETEEKAEKEKEEEKKKKEEEGIMDKANKFAENIGGILPMAKNWSKETKRKVGYAVTLVGGAILAGILAQAFRKGTGTGSRVGIIGGVLVGGACLVGMGMYAKKLENMYAKGQEKLKKGWESAMAKKDKLIDRLTGKKREKTEENEENKERPWEDYGMTEEQYKKAEEVCKLNPLKPEEWEAELKVIFESGAGESSADFEDFYRHMKNEHERREDPDSVVRYASVDRALYNYEQNAEVGLSELWREIEKHALEVGLGTLFLSKIGALRMAWIGAVKSGKGGLALASFVGRRVGRFARNNPLVAFLMMAGTAGTAFAALKVSKKRPFAPENLPALSVACNQNKDIVMGELEGVGAEQIEQVKEYGNKVGVIGDNIAGWAAENAATLVGSIFESIPEMIGATESEIAVSRTDACLGELARQLENKQKTLVTISSVENVEMNKKLGNALIKLADFQEVQIEERCVKFSESDKPVKAFEELKKALDEVGVITEIKDGVVTWKFEDGEEALDLCIDPSIVDKEQIMERVKYINHGDEDPTYCFWLAVDRLQEVQQKAMEKGELLPFGDSKAIAMIAGNFLYFVPFEGGKLDFENLKNCMKVPLLDLPIDTVKELTGCGEDSNWSATFSTATVSTAMFSLNAGLLAKVKRFAIGGGPIAGRTRLGRLGSRVGTITPGVAQVRFGARIWQGVTDARLVRNLSWAHGRDINNLFRDLKMRPEWIVKIQNGNRNTLLRVAKKLRIDKAETIEDLETLRQTCWDRVESNIKSPHSRAFRGDDWTRGDFKQIRKDVLRTLDKNYVDEIEDVLDVSDVDVDGAARITRAESLLKQAGASDEVIGLLKRTGASDELVDALNRSPELAGELSKHLNGLSADEAADAIRRLDRLCQNASGVDDILKNNDLTDIPRLLNLSDTMADAASLSHAEHLLRQAGAVDDVIDSLKAAGVSDNMLSALNQSPDFAKALATHLGKLDDPADMVKVLSQFDVAFKNIDDVAQAHRIAKAMKNEARVLKVLAFVDEGGDMTKLFRVWSKIGKVCQAGGVAFDVFAIGYSIWEMVNTYDLIQKETDNEELRNLYYQRYVYLGAEAMIGVIGIGAVAVGGTVATPVVLATIPVSFVIYGAYEGHKWRESKTKTDKDWMDEMNAEQLIATLRSQGFSESLGQGWDQYFGGWKILRLCNPLVATEMMVTESYRWATGEREEAMKRLAEDMKNVNREQVEALVAHTTTMQIPETVRGEDGKERPLTDEEVNAYKEKLAKYVKAKTYHIMSLSKNVGEQIASGADVRELMEDAEYLGLFNANQDQLKRTAKEAKESGDTETLNTIVAMFDKDISHSERARLYKAYVERQQLEMAYAQVMMQDVLVRDEEQREAMHNVRKTMISNMINTRTNHIVLDFKVRCEEENFDSTWYTFGYDGSAKDETTMLMFAKYGKVLEEKSAKIADQLQKRVQEESKGKESTSRFKNPVDELEFEINAAVEDIEDLFLGTSPRQLYERMVDNPAQYERVQEIMEKGQEMAELQNELDNLVIANAQKKFARERELYGQIDDIKKWIETHPVVIDPAETTRRAA